MNLTQLKTLEDLKLKSAQTSKQVITDRTDLRAFKTTEALAAFKEFFNSQKFEVRQTPSSLETWVAKYGGTAVTIEIPDFTRVILGAYSNFDLKIVNSTLAKTYRVIVIDKNEADSKRSKFLSVEAVSAAGKELSFDDEIKKVEEEIAYYEDQISKMGELRYVYAYKEIKTKTPEAAYKRFPTFKEILEDIFK